MLGVLYENNTRIHDHRASKGVRPLASVAFHPAEDFNSNSLLRQAFRRFIRRGTYELTGMSFDKYIGVPHDVYVMMNEEIDSLLSDRKDQLEKSKKEMNDPGKP